MMKGKCLLTAGWREALLKGTWSVAAMLPVFLLAPLLWQQAGMPYPGAYTALMLTAVLGTGCMAWLGRPLLVLPSLSLTVWLVWLVMLAGGLNWQFVLSVQAIAAGVGLLLCCLPVGRRLTLLPPVLHWAMPVCLALMLLLFGLVQGRLLIHSPWAVTMLGDFHDPMAYLAVCGLVILAVLYLRRVQGAVLWSGLVTGGLALMEGFWEWPDAPLLFPEGLDRVALMLNPWLPLPDGGMSLAVMTGLALLLVLGSYSWSAGIAAWPDMPQRRTLAVLYAINVGAAFLGCLPVTVAPASAISAGEGDRLQSRRIALVMLAWLGLLLACEPIVKRMADFPVMAVPMLVGTGSCLLLRELPQARGLTWQRTEVLTAAITLLLALSWNVTAALGTGLLVWVVGQLLSGQQARVTWSQRLAALVYLAYLFFAPL